MPDTLNPGGARLIFLSTVQAGKTARRGAGRILERSCSGLLWLSLLRVRKVQLIIRIHHI